MEGFTNSLTIPDTLEISMSERKIVNSRIGEIDLKSVLNDVTQYKVTIIEGAAYFDIKNNDFICSDDIADVVTNVVAEGDVPAYYDCTKASPSAPQSTVPTTNPTVTITTATALVVLKQVIDYEELPEDKKTMQIKLKIEHTFLDKEFSNELGIR